ncbi:IclR family transcriptional regulator [Haladaptatus sp. ZSTT2]|uniref:IclR family transcriptional regulator n=1 Tax=Haladaptatus sp. ZSTT2 TaxID=3120515 RepID=UPI00300ED01F
MTTHKPRRTLQTTETTLDVIELLKEKDGGRVTELAADLDLAPSTVHSHLTTLHERDYVVKFGDIYYLSLQFLNLGNYVQNRLKSYQIANSYTKQMAEETDCRAIFAVEENGRGVYMYTESGKHAVWKYSNVGQKFYLHQTAAGKAILSQLPRSRVHEIVTTHGLPAATENTITDVDVLVDQLDAIKSEGVSYNYEEQLDGVKAVGVPVKGRDGRIIGAFSVASPANRMTPDRFETELPKILLGIANEFELEISLS